MTVDVPIGSSLYHVELDGSNYSLSKDSGKKNEKTGEMPKTYLGYFTTMDKAVGKIIDDQFASKSEVVGLKDFIEQYSKLSKEIKSLLL